jgi:hypothetical protein
MFLGLLLIFWVFIRFTFLLMFFGLDKIYLCDFSKYWSTDLPNFLAVMIFSIVLLKIVDTLTTPFYQEVWHGRSVIIRTRWINGHALEYLLIETPQYAENGSLDDILFTPARRSRAFKVELLQNTCFYYICLIGLTAIRVFDTDRSDEDALFPDHQIIAMEPDPVAAGASSSPARLASHLIYSSYFSLLASCSARRSKWHRCMLLFAVADVPDGKLQQSSSTKTSSRAKFNLPNPNLFYIASQIVAMEPDLVTNLADGTMSSWS